MNTDIKNVSADIIESYWKEVSQSAQPATLKRKAASLNKFFDWAAQEGHIDKNPMASSVPTPTPTVLIPDNPTVVTLKKAPLSSFKTWTFMAISISMAVLAFTTVAKLQLPIPFIQNRAADIAGVPNVPSPTSTPTPFATNIPAALRTNPPIIPADTALNPISNEAKPLTGAISILHLTGPSTAIDSDGSLLIDAKSLTAKARDGSDGNITLNPDGKGTLQLLFEGTGKNMIDAQASNLVSGSLFYGKVANNSTGYNFLTLQGGANPITRFQIDSVGNVFASGNINTNGNFQTGGTTRLNSLGRLTSITGYYQDSGNFEISQGAADYAKITKNLTTSTGASSADLLTLSIDESLISSGSNSKTLVLKRLGGGGSAMALLVDSGVTQLNGNFAALGNITLGDGNTDALTFNARINEDSDIIPFTTSGTNDLGSTALPWDNVYATSFTQNGNLVCDASGSNCPTGATQYWSQSNGALFPLSNSVDFLIGGSATSSAKFAFKGVSAGTPTASISGTTANVSTFIDGQGNISTTNRANLVLGNSTTYNSTGNIIFNPNGVGNIGIGTSSPTYQIDSRSVNKNGFNNVTVYDSSAPSSIYGTYNQLDVETSTTNAYGLYSVINGDLGTPTNSYAIYAASVIGTNNYGVYIADGLNSATNSYGIYQAGSNDYNYFAGNVGIGTISPTSKLSIADTSVTTGNVFNATTSGITSGNIIKLGQGGDTSFSGNVLYADIDNTGGGSFNGNFLRFDNAASTKFALSSSGVLTLANSETIDNSTDGTVNIGTTTLKLTGGTDVVSDQTSVNLLNTTTTTLNIGGAATTLALANGNTAATLNLGSGTGGNTINLGTGVNTSAQTVNIATGTTASNSTVNILTGNSSLNTQTFNLFTGTPTGGTQNINIGTGINAGTITIGKSGGLNNSGSGSLVSLPGGLFSSGVVTGKANVILNSTGGTQNILTASSSGTTVLTLARSGDLTLTSNTSTADSFKIVPFGTAGAAFTGTLTSADLTGTSKTWTLPDATGTVCLDTGNCSSVGNYWQLGSLVVSPANSTYDLAIGGTATGSGFQVFGSPTASGNRVKLTSTGITTGSIFEATASALTSGNIVKLGQGGDAAFSGNGLYMDFDNTGGGGGTFTGNFLKFDNAGSNKFKVDSSGDAYVYDSLRTLQNSVNSIDLHNSGISIQSYFDAAYYIDNDNNDTTEKYQIKTNGGQSTLLTILQDGASGTSAVPYVGIGTTSPTSLLHLVDSSTTTGSMILATASAITSGNILKLGTGGNNGNFTGNGLFMDFDNTGGNSFTGNFLKFNNAGTTTFTLSSTGQLLVPDGTAAVPSYGFLNNTNMGFYRAGNNTLALTANGQPGWFTDGSSGVGQSYIADSPLTAADLGKFTVRGTRTGKALVMFNDTGGDSDLFTASVSGVPKFTIQHDGTATSSGNITLYGSSPTIATTAMKNLTIGDANTGGLILGGSLPAPGGTLGDICISGTNVVLATGTSCSSSSQRFKNTILDANLGLAEVMKMRPVTFFYNDDSLKKNKHVGFIAEDVEKINPILVDYDKQGIPANVRYENYTAVLTKAIQEQQQKIEDLTKDVSKNTSVGLKIVTKNLEAGLIVSGNIAADSINSIGGTFDELLVKTGLVSPKIKTALITPLDGDSDLAIQIGSVSTPSGKLAIKDVEGTEVASIDSTGNANFNGTVTATEVKSKSIDEIRSLLSQVENDQEILKQTAAWNIQTATTSANFESLSVGQLYITGQAAINSLFIAKGLSMGPDLLISSGATNGSTYINSIDTIKSPLRLQSLAAAPVEIMGGLIRIDTEGNMDIQGNLNVAGVIKSSGLTLTTNSQDNDILYIKDTSGATQAAVSASGSANFSSVAAENFIIAGAKDAATSLIVDGVINSNSPIGSATIPAGVNEIIVKNPKVTDYSLVYVTPTSDTENKVLYVKSKTNGEFKVGFTDPIGHDTNFNWWIVQFQN